MKKIVVLVGLLIVTTFSWAQQGSWYIGGQFGIGSEKSENYNTNVVSKDFTANISPEVGTFLTNDIAVGVALNLSTFKFNNNVSNTNYDKVFLMSPVIYARKFWSVEEIFSIFAGLDVNFSTGNLKENRNDQLDVTDKISGFGSNVNVGIAFPLGQKFTAVGKYGLLGFSSLTYKDQDGVKQSTDSEFGFNVNTLGSLFNIGLYYTFISK